MRFAIYLAVILAFVHSNSALKCYMCLGSLKSDCKATDVESKVIQSCNIAADKKVEWFEDRTGLKAPRAAKAEFDVCVKLDAEDSELISNLMERGCGFTYDDLDICEYIIATNPAIRNCEWCVGDLCNL